MPIKAVTPAGLAVKSQESQVSKALQNNNNNYNSVVLSSKKPKSRGGRARSRHGQKMLQSSQRNIKDALRSERQNSSEVASNNNKQQ